MVGSRRTPLGAWILLAVAVLAVSSGGIVLQEMNRIPPILRASWRMQGTALVLLPGFVYQTLKSDYGIPERKESIALLLSSLFLAQIFSFK